MQSLCIYCGSRAGQNDAYKEAAQSLGKLCAEKNIRIVFGGGHVGLMGLAANACLENSGEVLGVIPQHLVDWEVAHTGLTELKVVKTMHERKAIMADESDAFLALPGGYGTLDEIFEIATWSQLGLHSKPVGIWNVNAYFDHLIHFMNHATNEGFVSENHKRLIFHSDDIHQILGNLLLK